MGFLSKLFGPKKPKSNLPKIDVNKRFELLGRTGQGSMSKVWRARDRSLGRIVCVKLLDKEKTAKFEARFIGLHRPMEGAICTALRHKNVVQTFEYGLTTSYGSQTSQQSLAAGTSPTAIIAMLSSLLPGQVYHYRIVTITGQGTQTVTAYVTQTHATSW